MKKILFVVAFLLLNTISFAEKQTFIKEGESVVQKDQSVNQVIDYLKQKLTREAQDEAGKFITSELNIENKSITKDEYTSFAGSIATTTVLEETPFMIGSEQYVKVKIKADIDTDNVKAYLEKMMQDKKSEEQAKKAIKENEELKKKNLELEEQLKTATKKQYEQELSAKVQQQIALKEQREIEINKMAIQAKEEYIKAKEEQEQEQAKREQELLELKQQIAQEKNNIKKAELENQAKIRELEAQAKENERNWENTDKEYIQESLEQAKKVKQETINILNQFENLIKNNKELLIKSYKEQQKLSVDNSKKDEWESEEEYNERLERNRIMGILLKYEQSQAIFEDEIKSLKSMVLTIAPFIMKLNSFQIQSFYDKNGSKATLNSVGNINVDKKFFIINVKFNGKKYSLNYDFSEIGKEKAKLIYQTPNQFIIEPLYSINNNLKELVVGFNVRHLGTQIEQIIKINADIKEFEEITKFNKYAELEVIDVNLKKLTGIFIKKKSLRKFKDIISNLFNAENLNISDKIKRIDDFKKLFYEIGNLIVDVDTGDKYTVGLKLNGTVVATGNNFYGQCNVKDWKDIVSIAVGKKYTIGLKRDGSLIACGDDTYSKIYEVWHDISHIFAGDLQKEEQLKYISYYIHSDRSYKNKVNGWTDIVSISAARDHIVGLKSNGTVVACGWNEFGQCNVDGWNNIVAVSCGIHCTFGLTEFGTVVTTNNKLFNVKNWKDIVEISAGDEYLVGLKSNGTIVLSCDSYYLERFDVWSWENIVKISAGYNNIVGIKSDGTLVATSSSRENREKIGCDVEKWSIKIPKF